jgi:MFS family permease
LKSYEYKRSSREFTECINFREKEKGKDRWANYHLSFPPVVWSLPGLIAPKGTVGSVTGIMNFLNNVAGIAAPIVTGFIAGGTGSFANAFITAGIVLLIGILSYVFLLEKIEQIPSQGSIKNEEVTSA